MNRIRLFAFAAASLAAHASFGATAAGLPETIRASLLSEYGADARYLAAHTDLDGDGHDEYIVYLVSPMHCGTGGCNTLVFTPRGDGYETVGDISVTQTPIGVSSRRSAGWRNLVVQVAGGGAQAADIELGFDGERYPGNPTVSGRGISPAVPGEVTVVIPDFTSFEDATPLAAAAATPSFDCAKARLPVEKLVCGDPELAQLDRNLADAFEAAMSGADWPEAEKAAQRETQHAWINQRNQCSRTTETRDCVEAAYRERLITVQIQSGQLEAPSAVYYDCEGREIVSFFASFYQQTDPRSVVLTLGGDRQSIAFAVLSGSGTHYVGKEVDFWEHHGEATVAWSGESFTCRPH